MKLLEINGIDFSKHINESSYNVSRQSVYEEWIDANYKIHRSEYRKRVTGSFDMVFIKDEDYDLFLNQINSSNLIRMTVYVGGLLNRRWVSDFYLTIESKSHREINSSHIFNKLTVKIEEA